MEGPSLPAGALARYRSVWPERDVRWDPKRDRWAIWQTNPDTGVEERIEILTRVTATEDRAFQPFDDAWVSDRLRQRALFLELGPERYSEIMRQKNARVSLKRLGTFKEQLDYLAVHDRRWLPALAEAHATNGRFHRSQLTTAVIPQVPGADFGAGSCDTPPSRVTTP